jgi:hypothetical protein
MKSKPESRTHRADTSIATAVEHSHRSSQSTAVSIGNQAMQSLLSAVSDRSAKIADAPVSSKRVDETLRSPGRPLEAATRADMESRLGHDFADVRVHTGDSADASSNAIAARAYTVENDVVFEAGAYAPQTSSGRRLLAHELTHVVQQRGATRGTGPLRVENDRAAETEADAVADSVAKVSANARPSIRQRAEHTHIARQPKASEFPGFSQQDFVTCGAASLVSAIMIWDRERKDPGAPNKLLIAACNAVLVYLDDNKNEVVKRLDAIKYQGSTGQGQTFYTLLRNNVESVRTNALVAGTPLTQTDYENLSIALYMLYKENNNGGMIRSKIQSVQNAIGIGATKTMNADSFDAIMDKLIDLQPGQVAQVVWYSRGNVRPDGTATFTNHVFLVGRFQRGAWFVSDQGSQPATELEAADLNGLKIAIKANTLAKDGGIHTGGLPAQTIGDMQVVPLNLDKGVMILGDRTGIETKARNVVMVPGDFIAEVDASSVRDGDRIVAWDFVARTYNLADAQTALTGAGTGSGGVIVENPIGLFHVFKTNLVADRNVMETKIDESDSAGGRVAPIPKRYYHAWLQLRSSTRIGAFFKVY